MSVGLSVRIFQKPRVQISPNFLYMLAVAKARSFDGDSAISYVPVFTVSWMTSCCHNGANGPKSSTTLYFVQFARWRHQGSAVIDCILFNVSHPDAPPHKKRIRYKDDGIPAKRCASAVALCPSVCLSQVGVPSKR